MSIKNEHKMLETPYTRDRVKGVLPAFVMRARLISRPHYVRLRIIAIHCDFSSESYIHIDPPSVILPLYRKRVEYILEFHYPCYNILIPWHTTGELYHFFHTGELYHFFHVGR